MDSSSENSFAWTDTLSDSSRNSIKSTSMAADDINDFSNENFSTNDEKKTKKDKKLKKNHHDLSASLEPNFNVKEEKPYFENTINSSGKKKHIKIEADMCKKKKNNKILETDEEQESMSYDETYLNMKVKQEHSSAACSIREKKKKLKQSSSVDSSTTELKSHENNNYSPDVFKNNVILKEETDDTKMSNTKKKKKRLKIRHSSDNQNLDIEEKMDIEDTVGNHNADSFVTNKTLNTTQEESEESGCDEISAIKCDDSHSPHTISLINKNIDEENIKVNYNNSLNINTKLAGSVPEYDSNKKLEVAKSRKQRISDRLRFEDDEDDINMSGHIEHDSSENNIMPLKLQKFIKTHPNLKLVPQTVNDNAYLTRDDEICIVRCPKELHIKDFENTTMNIQGKCKIKVAGQTYELSVEEQSDTTSLLTIEQNIYKIRNMPLNGIIHLRKRIPKAHFRDDNIMVNNQTNFIPLPETKCRHPLFGSNYKKALKIPAAIVERLNVQDSEDSLVRTATRKKTKDKKRRNTLELVNPHAQSDITTKIEPELPEEVREKKKSYKCHKCPSTFTHKSDLKSHKSAHTHENWSDINIKTEPEHPVEVREKKKKKHKMVDDELSASKKVKRMKHDPDSAEAWESEKAIEENLFNF